ncbi:hypothetical protein FHS27_006438 [Rhodopirellula rubra]|uniref:Uncharacterized protein n=1 Tax=Aporhodopirellula rubra TaxID=980271 RepID=A0A7W5E5I7_9BACT|nr:hypothetical protein [Aporhodopirellula rubra]MBB3210590.1 hypothetical protein [Aporhodopirellula rubra]
MFKFFRPLSLLIAIPLLSLAPSIAEGQEDSRAILRRLVTTWQDYEGIVVDGTIEEFQGGSSKGEKRFRAIYGTAESATELRPICIGYLVPNPGEPHLDEKELFDYCMVVKNGLLGQFRRGYISETKPANYRCSNMYVTNITDLPRGLSAINRLMVGGPDGFTVDETGAFGQVDLVMENLKLDVLGDDEFLGHKCKRVRVTYRNAKAPTAGTIRFEQLVSLEPSARILDTTSVTGSNELIVNQIKERLDDTEVESLQVFGGRLIATRASIYGPNASAPPSRSLYFRINVDTVESLPNDYHGLWSFDGPSGTLYGGPAESAVRHLGVRADRSTVDEYAAETALNEVSFIDFTPEQHEKIRRFLKIDNVPKVAGTSRRILFLGVNIVAVLLCWVFWRRRNRASGER